MKRKTLLVASLAVALVLGMSIVPAGAYFTDTTTANGGAEVKVKPTTEIEENVDNDGVKHVQIKNADDSTLPVYVRAGVFATVDGGTIAIGGNGWSDSKGDLTDGHGWYYYETILDPKQSTNELTVAVDFPVVPEGSVDSTTAGDTANVIVVYESTPVLYKDDGTPYADWSLKANQAPEGGN